MTTQPAGDERLLVHNWRMARLTRLGIPRALAEVYADRLDWHQVASPADERTRLPGTGSPCLPDRSRRSWTAISPRPPGSTVWPCESQASGRLRTAAVNSSLTVQGRAGALVEAPKPGRRS